jgi:hypothetical protein
VRTILSSNMRPELALQSLIDRDDRFHSTRGLETCMLGDGLRPARREFGRWIFPVDRTAMTESSVSIVVCFAIGILLAA